MDILELFFSAGVFALLLRVDYQLGQLTESVQQLKDRLLRVERKVYKLNGAS